MEVLCPRLAEELHPGAGLRPPPEYLTNEQLEPNPLKALSFYFLFPGTFTVSVTTADGPAQASFDVMAPKVEVPEPSTCAVALDTKYARPTLKLPVFGPGWNDVCGEKPGIKFQSKVTPQVDGSIAVIQIVDATLNNFTHLVGVDTYPEFPVAILCIKGWSSDVPGAERQNDDVGR